MDKKTVEKLALDIGDLLRYAVGRPNLDIAAIDGDLLKEISAIFEKIRLDGGNAVSGADMAIMFKTHDRLSRMVYPATLESIRASESGPLRNSWHSGLDFFGGLVVVILTVGALSLYIATQYHLSVYGHTIENLDSKLQKFQPGTQSESDQVESINREMRVIENALKEWERQCKALTRSFILETWLWPADLEGFCIVFPPLEAGDPQSGSCVNNGNLELACANSMLGRAKVMIKGIQFYVLPVLIGLLGGLAGILMDFYARHRLNVGVTNRWSYATLQMVRLILAAFSGAVVGLIFKDDSSLVFGEVTVSLAALTFLMGYSSNLLFTFLDQKILQIREYIMGVNKNSKGT